jgi:hypothetical protein
MFPRYVPTTDFGHIWEHLKTYAPLATRTEKYVAFMLPVTEAKNFIFCDSVVKNLDPVGILN